MLDNMKRFVVSEDGALVFLADAHYVSDYLNTLPGAAATTAEIETIRELPKLFLSPKHNLASTIEATSLYGTSL